MANKSIMAEPARPAHFMKAHLWSAVAFAWAFAAIKTLTAQISSGGFANGLIGLLMSVCSMFVLALIVALVLALIPLFVTWLVARQYGISSIWYYLAAGALIGAFLYPVTEALRPAAMWGQAAQPVFERGLTEFLVPMTLGGLAAGAVFWRMVGRFIRKADTVTAA
jgi:hypothetical protein